ncbi:MAG: GNAT family N-acetyltransferase [Candidatus Caldarchaeales archaeon]|jgi:ribosomal protein S18 acetylase RimI-like enzyme|nr:GNAT family N-acetyltransferase [Candidatus Caldarchaeales archaeon]
MRLSSSVTVRAARQSDRPGIVELVLRAKRLNEEFDPLLRLSPTVSQAVEKYVDEALQSSRSLVLVAEYEGKLVGVLKADIVDRLFYDPPLEGIIRELYVLPEFRRKGVASLLVLEGSRILKERDAGIITAEFPSLHKIAAEFYENMKFRPIFSKYAIETEKTLRQNGGLSRVAELRR